MAITRAQQAKQLLAQGGRIGLKGGADASQFGKSEQKTPNVSAGGASFNDLGPAPSREVRDRQKENYEKQFTSKTGTDAKTKAKAKAEAEAKEKRKTIRQRLDDFNLKQRQKYINRILSQRQKKISSGLFDVEDMPGVDLMETEDYFGFAPSITDYGPEGTGKYSQKFIDDVLSNKRQPPEFFSKIDVGNNPSLTTRGIATVANFLGKGMAGPVTREELERLNQEKIDIMNIDPSKTTMNEMMETYEPKRFKLLNPEPGGGGGNQDPCKGPNPPAYCFVNKTTTEPEPTGYVNPLSLLTPRIAGTRFLGTEFEDDTESAANGGRIGAMGGGIMNTDVMGGLADGGMDESGRQMYFLGKLVKKAGKAIKKITKSPIGKAALGFAAYKLGGGFLKGKGLMGTLFGQAGSRVGQPFIPFKEGFLTKLGLTKGGGSLMPTAMGGILGTSLLAGLMTPKEEDDEFDIDAYYAANRLNPNAPLNRRILGTEFYAADGGMPSKEPVAKKTMPLLDMDGQEMDLRAEGGFVPLGRMERADDVPARLSKNEFVFTADAVRNAGEGDIDKGAEVMYNMMKNLESGGEVSEESQGLEGAREMFQTSQRLEEVI